jgi:hypothetical protein
MPFVDSELNAGLAGKTVSGLALSQGAAMQLDVASGSVTIHETGVTHSFSPGQNHVFTADATNPTRVFMAIISDGVNVDLWVDAYVDDGFKTRADIPAGFSIVADVAWFTIAANETDLLNGDIGRRVWI